MTYLFILPCVVDLGVHRSHLQLEGASGSKGPGTVPRVPLLPLHFRRASRGLLPAGAFETPKQAGPGVPGSSCGLQAPALPASLAEPSLDWTAVCNDASLLSSPSVLPVRFVLSGSLCSFPSRGLPYRNRIPARSVLSWCLLLRGPRLTHSPTISVKGYYHVKLLWRERVLTITLMKTVF